MKNDVTNRALFSLQDGTKIIVLAKGLVLQNYNQTSTTKVSELRTMSELCTFYGN